VQIPTPANPENVQRQRAIFEVARRSRGKTMTEVKAMLTKAFAERGLSRQPGTWLDAVASDAVYGKPYIINLPAAIEADSTTSASDPQIEEDLRERRNLRAESDTEPEGAPEAVPASADPRRAVTAAWAADSSKRWLVILATAGVGIAVAGVAIRLAQRPRQ